jgi:hypothetical protein
MFHSKRIWTIKDCPSPAAIGAELDRLTWCVCAGFRAPLEDGGAILVLNDATSPDGAQEYGVVVIGPGAVDKLDNDLAAFGHARVTAPQIESLTASWMAPGEVGQTLDALAKRRREARERLQREPSVAVATRLSDLRAALGGEDAPSFCQAEVTIEASGPHRGKACCA